MKYIVSLGISALVAASAQAEESKTIVLDSFKSENVAAFHIGGCEIRNLVVNGWQAEQDGKGGFKSEELDAFDGEISAIEVEVPASCESLAITEYVKQEEVSQGAQEPSQSVPFQAGNPETAPQQGGQQPQAGQQQPQAQQYGFGGAMMGQGGASASTGGLPPLPQIPGMPQGAFGSFNVQPQVQAPYAGANSGQDIVRRNRLSNVNIKNHTNFVYRPDEAYTFPALRDVNAQGSGYTQSNGANGSKTQRTPESIQAMFPFSTVGGSFLYGSQMRMEYAGAMMRGAVVEDNVGSNVNIDNEANATFAPRIRQGVQGSTTTLGRNRGW